MVTKKIAGFWEHFINSCADKLGAYVIIGIIGLFVWLYRIDCRQTRILDVMENLDTNKVNKTDFYVFKMYFEGRIQNNDLRFQNIEQNVNRIMNGQPLSRSFSEDTLNIDYYGILKPKIFIQ